MSTFADTSAARGARALLLLVACLLTAGAGWPDLLVPARTGQRAPADAAVVVGIERYAHLPQVPHAHRDAEAFHQWLLFTRGVPADRVTRLEDPTSAQVAAALDRALQRVGPGGVLWFYWAGHGAASQVDARHYLLGRTDAPEGQALAVEALQDTLAASRADRVMLILDTSFGGVGRDGAPLAGTRRYHVPEAALPDDPRVVTWTAAGPFEVAGALEPVRQGLFTWHVLGALTGWADGVFGERDGHVTLEEAQTWVRRRLHALDRPQTPGVDPRPSARAWVIGPAHRAAPALDDLDPGPPPPVDPLLVAEDEEARRVAADRAEAEAEIRRQVQEQADKDWARTYGLARAGTPEGLEALRRFLQRYTARTYLYDDMEIVVSAAQVPEARRLLASGGRSDRPLVETVRVEPATFELGSPVGAPGRRDDETLHTVTVTRPLLVGVTEVTRRLFTTVMGHAPRGRGGPEVPATGVSWLEAVVFCNALSRLDGFDPAYQVSASRVEPIPGADGWRLPTEAEWVLAAGDDLGDPADACTHANVLDRSAAPDGPAFPCDDGHPGLAPVRALGADDRGLYGMHGNVAEWTWDAYLPFDGAPAVDPAPHRPRKVRVVKGGSFRTGPGQARLQGREGVDAGTTRDDLGFRVVRNPR